MYREKFTATITAAILMLSSFNPAVGDEGHESGNEPGEHEDGVLHLSAEAKNVSGIELKEVGPGTLVQKLRVNGRIAPISSKVAHIAPRFPGIIRDVKKDVGDRAEAGDLLAVVESNQALQAYEVRASRPGLITDRHATVGESVQADEALFTLMDLGQVNVDFTVFQRDVGLLKVGQPVSVLVSGVATPITTTLQFISPIVDEATQSRVARAVVPNPDGQFAPGAFVTGQIGTGTFNVPLVVNDDAIQAIDGKPVVFISDGERFKKRVITTGRTDQAITEVLSGLKAGERYAATNSFILKAELGKAEAEHED